jgi:hypothetical protein
MALRILRSILFQFLTYLAFGCDSSAQNSAHLVYNFNEPIGYIGTELRAIKSVECYTNLLSINNVLSNYLLEKHDVPQRLLSFLIDKKIVPLPVETEELKRKTFLVARYIHSVHYDSYLLMVVKESTNEREDDIKDLYLINVKPDLLISVGHLASYLSGIGLTVQSYSVYQNNGIFENMTETISSDVELVQEEDKVKMKQEELVKVKIIIDLVSGKASRK